ncbi:YheC/YheD family protein [Alteribacter populi]|uniref:YheC/YheD family endospore coat-associated protein n=1 Tax=Alteribacter populi TaxID=2011011 RepID=UPI000BBB4D8A|nr:YheC/YheD family protein [Alteribacter populi]
MTTKQYKPLIGAFITTKGIRRLNKQKASKKNRLLLRASRIAKVNLYYFCFRDIDMKTKTIEGTYYNEHLKKWKKASFPFPDLFYNRKRRGLENRKYHTLKRALLKSGTQFINTRDGFDKWDVHKRLSESSEIKEHIPATSLFSSKEKLKEMLNEEEGSVYLKGVNASLGNEIMRVEKTTSGTYTISTYVKQVFTKKVDNDSSLIKEIHRFFGPFLRHVIIQKRIDLFQVEGCLVDFRAEVQKKKNDSIVVSGVVARIGKPGSPITSKTSEDHYMTIEEFIKRYYSHDHNLKSQINGFLKKVYEAVEQEYGRFAELGIDIGLDQEGRLWLIECNGTSGKSAFCNAYDGRKRLRAFTRPLLYGKNVLKKARV